MLLDILFISFKEKQLIYDVSVAYQLHCISRKGTPHHASAHICRMNEFAVFWNSRLSLSLSSEVWNFSSDLASLLFFSLFCPFWIEEPPLCGRRWKQISFRVAAVDSHYLPCLLVMALVFFIKSLWTWDVPGLGPSMPMRSAPTDSTTCG